MKNSPPEESSTKMNLASCPILAEMHIGENKCLQTKPDFRLSAGGAKIKNCVPKTEKFYIIVIIIAVFRIL